MSSLLYRDRRSPMSVQKDYDPNNLPAPQLIKRKDANNIVREVRLYPFSGDYNNSLWYFFELCMMPLLRCITALKMSWPDIFIEILNVLTKHPLQLMTQLLSGKYSVAHAQHTQTTFIHMIRDFVSALTLTCNPRDTLYHYLETSARFDQKSDPATHWSKLVFLRQCGIYMNGNSAVPNMGTLATWYFNNFPPGWRISYVMHNPTETGIPSADKISNHMAIAQQTNTDPQTVTTRCLESAIVR